YTQELERSNEELEQFAFIASHDLQEPLRMITGFMDLLKRKYENQLDENANKYIFYAFDGAMRMKKIILDLLEYSRAKRQLDAFESVDLGEVVSEYLLLRRKVISEKRALIHYDNLPSLNTYKAAVVQIFHCLLDNALKYSKDDETPEIVISAKESKSDWLFSIQDNGIGIDEKFHQKIFVIFQRLHSRDSGSGTGAGLSIAKRHVELLGGKLWLDSTPGIGSTFYFTMPKN
ncbi:MAG: histidine kinase, partial [Cyclobacteriaceae bacterium]|nr:histidine kinase [Cyclobacteriaceae bacterium]